MTPRRSGGRRRAARGARHPARVARAGAASFTRPWPTRSAASTPSIIGPGSFYTSLMPPLLVSGVADALAAVRGPIILIANLLTEGRGMAGFTAADAVQQVSAAIDRHVDVAIVNTRRPPEAVLAQYEAEHKAMLPLGDVPAVVRGHRGRLLARRRSRGTTAGGWRTPCGACFRSACCSLRRSRPPRRRRAPRASVRERALLLLLGDGDGPFDDLQQTAGRALRRAVAGPDRPAPAPR